MLTAALALEALSVRVATEVSRGIGQGAEGLPEVQRELVHFWQTVAPTLPTLNFGPGSGVETLYLVTEIYPAGGHRQLLEQMIRSRPGERHLVVFTGALQIRARFSRSRLRSVGANIMAPNPRDVLWDKWLWLRKTIAAVAPQRIVLAHHSEDVLAALIAEEVAPSFGPRLMFLRHADTVGTLGANLVGATHLAIRPEQAAALRAAIPERRVELLPLCYDPAADLPQLCAENAPMLGRLGLPLPRHERYRRYAREMLREAVWAARRLKHRIRYLLAPYIPRATHRLITATCGTEHKFTCDGALALPRVIAAVLKATGGRHVHIGPASAALVAAVRATLETEGISKRRVVFTQEVPSVADTLRWHRVGLYLGSFPVSGALSRAEAAYAGIPIAARDPRSTDPAARYLAGTDMRPAEALIWHDTSDLAAHLHRGLSEGAFGRLSRSARDWYRETHSPEQFGIVWDDILGRLPSILAPRAPFPLSGEAVAPDARPLGPTEDYQNSRLSPLERDAAKADLLFPAQTLRLSRPQVFAAEHIAPVSLEVELPEVSSQSWPDATVIGGADGFLTADSQWKDDSLDGFTPRTMSLRTSGAVVDCTDDTVALRYRAPQGGLEVAIFGCGAYTHNYFHFLLEVLPRIAAAAAHAPAQAPIVTEQDLPQQHYQALRLLFPDNPLHLIRRGDALRVRQLHEAGMGSRVLDPRVPEAVDDPSILRYHTAQLRQLAELRTMAVPGDGPERLLLHRRAKVRKLLNFPQISMLLQRRGFEVHDTAGLDFTAQIRLMSRVKTIVAPTGAHLANMVFAPPGCQIFALFSDAPGTNFRLWSALGACLGHEVINLVGPRSTRRRPAGIAAAHAHFTVPPGYLEAFFPAETAALPAELPALLTALHGMAARADVLTGAWALRAEPTPREFTERRAALRRAAVAALETAPEAALKDLTSHAFFTDYRSALRSGLLAFADLTPAETAGAEALAAQMRAALADPGRDVTALRRALLLAMLSLPCWAAPLPPATLSPALPEDLEEAWLRWAMQPPYLHRAGDDAAWVDHIARLLDGLADRLDASRESHDADRFRRFQRLATGMDLGQLLLVDVPLGAVHRARNRVLAHLALQSGQPRQTLRPASTRRRIGILCRTFEKGPDSEAVVAFFRAFDPERYEIFAYSVGFQDRVVSRDPAFDQQFDQAIAHRRSLPGDPAGIRAQILADDLDVFLYANATTYGLHPLDLALFHRVAPRQIILNSHVPMGLGYPSFDALLTGASDDPAQELPAASEGEALLRAPGPVINYLTSLHPRANPPLDRAALGLSESDVVLMNAGSSQKLRHESLLTMMRAVAGIPNGVLLLAPYNPGWAARSLAFAFNAQLAETAAEAGLDPARIRVLGELSVAEAEAALACADIYLNPFPHGGATMTHLALIYGVPPVTLRRRSTRSIDQFLVQSLGFGDLLVNSPEAYIARAQALAADPDARRALAQALRDAAKTPPFVDSKTYSKDMQNAVDQACEEPPHTARPR